METTILGLGLRTFRRDHVGITHGWRGFVMCQNWRVLKTFQSGVWGMHIRSLGKHGWDQGQAIDNC